MTAKELKIQLNRIIGLKVWATIGPSVGSIFSLDIGDMIKKDIPSKNPHLSEIKRNFKGEYSFLVECDWRIDSTNYVICGSEEPEDEVISYSLQLLEGETIKDIEFSKPGLDLNIYFTNDYILRLFCVFTNSEVMSVNYYYFTPEQSITIGCKGEIDVKEK